MGNPFADEMVVDRLEAGSYRAVLGPGWNLRPLPQGGIVTALALRAMAAELDDAGETLRTLLDDVHRPGQRRSRSTIDVEVLRRGRSMSHLRAEVRNEGAHRGHVTTAVFGRPRDGFAFTDLVARTCRRPRSARRSGIRRRRIGRRSSRCRSGSGSRVDPRSASRRGTDTPRTTSTQAFWYRFDETPWLDDGTIDPAAVVVLADTMPGAVGQRLGPTDRPWFGPSIDLSVHLFAPATEEWLLAVNRARIAGDGYASWRWSCGRPARSSPTAPS